MNHIQACIDLSQHIRATEDFSSSEAAKQEIQALGEAGIITSETQRKGKAVGFRKFPAHRYGDVDQEVVFDVLQDDLLWFERFQQKLGQWFQQRSSP